MITFNYQSISLINNTLLCKKWAATFAVFCCLTLLGACTPAEESVPTYTIGSKDFSIKVQAFGEVEAAKAQRILSPGRQSMIISWLAPENTIIKEGDVIARFDAQQIRKDSRSEELEMMKLQADIVRNNAVQTQQKSEISADQDFVKHEFGFVDQFAIDDLRIYSQLEIIDTLQNRDFLVAKDSFLSWKETSIDEQHDSEMSVLTIQRSGHEAKFERFQTALSKLEIVSPYSGLLVYEKDRRGEKPAIGQTVYPGRAIASIPNLDNLQAKLYVLANDAINLEVNQNVEFTLDAFPDQRFTGNVKTVSGFPRSIERGNPITYYELEASISQQSTTMLQPGRKLTATIDVQSAQAAITVPLQAIHHQEGQTYVYLKQGDSFVQQAIVTGQKNQFVIEVKQGVSAGSVVALSIPSIEDGLISTGNIASNISNGGNNNG